MSYLEHLSKLSLAIKFGDITDFSLSNYIRNITDANESFSQNREQLIEVLKANYLREVWVTEIPTKSNIDTEDLVDRLIASKDEIECPPELEKKSGWN